MAYVLGFFAADGCITVHANGGEYIDFHISDGELLYKIRNTMDSDHHIKERRWKKNESILYRMQIGSKEICNDLRCLGFREGKTNHMPFPNIPLEHAGDFIRGYFDGDGHVWTGAIHKKRKTQLEVIQTKFSSCSHDFLEGLQTYLRENYGAGGSILKRKKKNVYVLQYSINDSLLLYDLMYGNLQTDLFLERKKKVFDKFIKKRKKIDNAAVV